MKLPVLATLVAISLPAMAAAQTHELRRDRQDIRAAEDNLDRAQRYGERRHVREAQKDLRNAEREYRADWREHRVRNRNLYARGDWHAPFRYQWFVPGAGIRPGYYASRYDIGDFRRYHLPVPPRGARWVRHYDDVVLVDFKNGRVVNVIHDFFG